MAITTDVALLTRDAVLGPAGAPVRELVVATGADRDPLPARARHRRRGGHRRRGRAAARRC